MITNRDIYLSVVEIAERAGESSRNLEEYLRALLGIVCRYQEFSELSPSDFISILSDSLMADPLPYHADWVNNSETESAKAPVSPLAAVRYPKIKRNSSHFTDFEGTVQRQVVDLREMYAAGTFEDEMRYFGVAAPRGAYWYNFDIGTYLKCAVAGGYGGWEPEDPASGQPVAEEAAVLDAGGSITIEDPARVKSLRFPVQSVTWADFISFVHCGQSYE